MKAVRSHFIDIKNGDIQGLGVVHLSDHTRLVIYDEDYVAPLVHVVLSEFERIALIHALTEGFSDALPDRRPFRAARPRRCEETKP